MGFPCAYSTLRGAFTSPSSVWTAWSPRTQAKSMNASVALSVDRYSPLLGLTRTARDADGAALAQQVLRLVPAHVCYAITLGR